MQNTEQNNVPGLLLSVDFEKAFDSVSWSFIYKVMEFFGFGNSIISWIKTFNNNIKLSVNQCGNLSFFLVLAAAAAKAIQYQLFYLSSARRF